MKKTQNYKIEYPEMTDFISTDPFKNAFETVDKEMKEIDDVQKIHAADIGNPHQTTAAQVGAIATSQKGAAGGVAELDANGKVLSAQLPSYVDDVLEYASKASFPSSGETGKIYVATNTNLTYRWTGSAYVEISPSIALGETSSTAYRGDKGKQNATNITALQNALANLITPETIAAAQAAGIDLSGGGVLNLNRLVQLFIANAIVEEYDEGIWHVRKYASGRAECWGIASINWGTGKAGMGGYWHQQIGTTDFPADLFVDIPVVSSQAADAVIRAYIGCVTTKSDVIIYVLDGTLGGSVHAYRQSFIVKGKWK